MRQYPGCNIQITKINIGDDIILEDGLFTVESYRNGLFFGIVRDWIENPEGDGFQDLWDFEHPHPLHKTLHDINNDDFVRMDEKEYKL